VARNLTLKAFANSSPGLRFGNPGTTHPYFFKDPTLKELGRRSLIAEPAQLFQSCELTKMRLIARVSKQTLGWD